MKFVTIAATIVLASTASVLSVGQLGLLSGTTPERLGVTNGRLQPPALTPNSVGSQAGQYPNHPQHIYADIEPLTFSGDGSSAMKKLVSVLKETRNTAVISEAPDYVYAQSTSAVLKFVDDLEFWLDPQNSVIQVRSASRLGQKDFGVNRARIEAIRARFTSQPAVASRVSGLDLPSFFGRG